MPKKHYISETEIQTQCLQNILSSQTLYRCLYQPCFSFFTTRVYFKGDISLSQRAINSPYFSHPCAHFSRLPLAVLTFITSCCHSFLTLMSCCLSWKLLNLRSITCDSGTGVVFGVCLFVFVTPFCSVLAFTLSSPKHSKHGPWSSAASTCGCHGLWGYSLQSTLHVRSLNSLMNLLLRRGQERCWGCQVTQKDQWYSGESKRSRLKCTYLESLRGIMMVNVYCWPGRASEWRRGRDKENAKLLRLAQSN